MTDPVISLGARTYVVERHDNDNDNRITCTRCHGDGQKIITAPEGQGYSILLDLHRDDTVTGWLVDCALCQGTGGPEKPSFEEMLAPALGGDLREVALSIDNCYYITVYTNPARTQWQEQKAIFEAWHRYDNLS
jgi:hypothetical protein